VKYMIVGSLMIAILLAGCQAASESDPGTPSMDSPSLDPKPFPTDTPQIPTITASITPTMTDIAEASNCDIYIDFCIIEEAFFLSRPIGSQDNDLIEPGYRFGSTMGGTRPPHHGVEFENPTGTPVLASYSGKVVYAGDDGISLFSPWKDFYGNLIVIKHEKQFPDHPILFTLYAHLSTVDVRSGQNVKTGDKIGEVGLSGSASGSHLHFEIRTDEFDYGSVLNPELYLVPHLDGQEYRGGLAIHLSSISLHYPDLQINIQYYLHQNSSSVAAYQIHTYEETNLIKLPLLENTAIGDLEPGEYRITFFLDGRFYEKWVIIEPGKLTYTAFEVP
jgi:hypothetical protein